MTLNVAVTGYSGTGSSAVIDYLKEKENFEIALADTYEHVVLYYPNSIFDLYDKLIYNNDPLRSDEAIKEFKKTMDYLNKNNFGWFGSYQELLDEKFDNLVRQYLDSIVEGEIKDTFWYYNYKKVKFSFLKCIIQFGAKVILRRKIYKWGRSYVIDKNTMQYSFVDEKSFVEHTKHFISSYFDICRKNKSSNYVFDHLVWPSHANRIDLFDDTFKMIILHRDPRDLFFINKYYWCSPKVKTPGTYPLEVNAFCDYFRGMKRSLAADSDKVLNLNFEDLVYDYENTIRKIDHFLNIQEPSAEPKKYFDPKKSIVNTQSYVDKPQWKEELKVIEDQLSEYLYSFPYENKTEVKDMFL